MFSTFLCHVPFFFLKVNVEICLALRGGRTPLVLIPHIQQHLIPRCIKICPSPLEIKSNLHQLLFFCEDHLFRWIGHRGYDRTPAPPPPMANYISKYAELPSLKHDDFIFVQIAQIQLLSLLYDIGVFSHQQPPDMREEETSLRIMRVCVGLRILVVNAVVARPFKDVVLSSDAIH